MLSNRFLVFVLLVCCFSLPTFGQVTKSKTADFTDKGVAIGISAPDMIDQMMVIMPGLGSNAKSMLTEQSVKPYLMPPRRIGAKGTLSSYTLASCLEFYANFEKNFKVNLSPDFLAQKLSQEGKNDISNALRILVTDGTVRADIMPYDATRLPSSVQETDKYAIANYLHIFGSDDREMKKNFEVQKALMRGNPVIVELKVPESFDQLKETRFYTSLNTERSKVLPFVVVGYNLDLEAFEILSSWGPSWASDGYLWIDFDDFGKMAEHGYVMVPN